MPKVIIVWSDGCVYQNKNKVISNALCNLAQESKFEIHQKYLCKGHTQMECDSVHASIERKLKNREVHTPADYIAVTREARQKPFPYIAVDIDHTFFVDYTEPKREIYSSIRPGKVVSDPTVNDVVNYKYTSDKGIEFKLDFDNDDFAKLPQRKLATFDANICYKPLYRSRIKIKKQKWLHLQELKAVLPQAVHSFYDNIPYQTS